MLVFALCLVGLVEPESNPQDLVKVVRVKAEILTADSLGTPKGDPQRFLIVRAVGVTDRSSRKEARLYPFPTDVYSGGPLPFDSDGYVNFHMFALPPISPEGPQEDILVRASFIVKVGPVPSEVIGVRVYGSDETVVKFRFTDK